MKIYRYKIERTTKEYMKGTTDEDKKTFIKGLDKNVKLVEFEDE